jgi:hypothetical protein
MFQVCNMDQVALEKNLDEISTHKIGFGQKNLRLTKMLSFAQFLYVNLHVNAGQA